MKKEEINRIRLEFVEHLVNAIHNYGLTDPDFLQKFLKVGEESVNMSGLTSTSNMEGNL